MSSDKRPNYDFESVYNSNCKKLYNICYAYMRNSYDAEDCVEDAFVRLLTSVKSFSDDSHISSWLAVTAVNICKDKLKSSWHKKTVSLESVADRGVDDIYHSDDIIKAVVDLPSRYKEVILLYYYSDISTDDIAKLLHKPSSTVRNNLAKARMLLKEKLGRDFSEQ